MCLDNNEERQTLVNVQLEVVRSLEAKVENHEVEGLSKEEIQSALLQIALVQRRIISIYESDSSKCNPEDPETLANAWLDLAIASKRAGNTKDCIEAHIKRMELWPRYQATDATRLLGLEPGTENVQEISMHGIFELKKHQSPVDNCPHSNMFVPSKRAQHLGRQVKQIFLTHNYRLFPCQSILLRHVEDASTQQSDNCRRIFSANSFFHHRHDVYDAKRGFHNGKEDLDSFHLPKGLENLVYLFLFGLTVDRHEFAEALGSDDMELLLEAKLLRPCPINPDKKLVAEVQIYPLEPNVFGQSYPSDVYCLFITDFPMENLRLTRNAIMPVGYDTLELLSLTAGEMIRHGEPTASEGAHRNVQRRTPRRILDLCCGCGIQGIFALKCFEGSKICPHNTCSCVLVSVDINDRAMHFVGANLALNEVCVTNPDENHDDESNSAVAVCGDLYHPLAQQHPDNKYDWILCNPPFVATPLCPVGPQTISPALYAVGGGVDGMDCLRRILKHLFTYLSNDNPQAMAFLVTEVPNVEDSCMMLQSMLFQSEQDKARIRVVYVEEDVETVEEYSRERESEAGNVLGSISEADSLSQVCRDWSSPMLEVGIRNRALVLISFARMPSGHNNNEKQMGLYAFSSATDDPGKDRPCDVDPIDEEDALLQPQGMAFSRAALLF